MDILLDIFSSVVYIFLGIIGLILLYFSLKYIVFITIDLFCIIVSFPFYLLINVSSNSTASLIAGVFIAISSNSFLLYFPEK